MKEKEKKIMVNDIKDINDKDIKGSKLRENLCCITILISALAAVWASFNVLTVSVAFGESMLPAYEDGAFFVEQRAGLFDLELERFDVVTFFATDNSYLNKRIVALPGETVQIKGGEIYINGDILNNPYIVYKDDYYINFESPVYQLKDNEYFILGDNQQGSKDSKSFGPVTKNQITGKSIYHFGH